MPFRPASGAAHGPGTLLALCEASHVSIWDTRAPGVAAVRLAAATPAPLLCLAAAAAPGGAGACMLATCGTERTLVVYDARTSRPLRSVGGLMRKDVTALRFAPVDSRYILAASIDYELQCRRWDAEAPRTVVSTAAGGGGGKRGFSLRGEARWAGIAMAGDVMAAYCASGALYASRIESAGDAGEPLATAAAPATARDADD